MSMYLIRKDAHTHLIVNSPYSKHLTNSYLRSIPASLSHILPKNIALVQPSPYEYDNSLVLDLLRDSKEKLGKTTKTTVERIESFKY